MSSSADSKMDACPQQIEDFDLGLVARSITQEVDHMVERVTIKKKALENVQSRVAVLHGTLLDHGLSTGRALKSAVLAKVRLCEAERAISRALGASRQYAAVEEHTAKQERDVARGKALQLKLHVELLNLFQNDGSGSILKNTYARLEDYHRLLSSELKDLAEHHSTLRAMLSTQNKAAVQERTCVPEEKLQLEARWIYLSSTLDNLCGNFRTGDSIFSVTSPDKQILLTETHERSDSLYQLCAEIEQISSLL